MRPQWRVLLEQNRRERVSVEDNRAGNRVTDSWGENLAKKERQIGQCGAQHRDPEKTQL
jgi:hypothetical protein